MPIEIRQIHPVFVGEVSGVDLTQPLTPDEVAQLEAGMDRYAVLVYHGQDITDDHQIAFSQNFGKLEVPDNKSNITKAKDRRLRAELADVSNLTKENRPYGRDDRQRMFNLGNQLWHSDSSFRAIPAKYSLLSGRQVPSEGGNTEFADMRAAYDALDQKTKDRIEDLICEHSLLFSRGLLGFDELSEDEKKNFTPVRQRLVRTHPVTGKKSLYVCQSFTTYLADMPEREGRGVLEFLFEHIALPEFQYRFQWRPNSIAFWDNRCTLHYAVADYWPAYRYMQRCSIRLDEVPV